MHPMDDNMIVYMHYRGFSPIIVWISYIVPLILFYMTYILQCMCSIALLVYTPKLPNNELFLLVYIYKACDMSY